MHIYFNNQAKEMMERSEPDSAGVFFDDDQDQYVGWVNDSNNNFDFISTTDWNRAFGFIKKKR